MAQAFLADRLRSTFWATETTFGSVPASPVQIYPQGVVEDAREQTEVELDDETVYLNDLRATVLGLKGGGAKLKLAVRPPATQLTSTATGAALTTAPNNVGLLSLFGGEQIKAGSLVVTGTSATSFSVTASDGAKFTPGQVILVGVAGVLYPTVIASISVDTITLALALPGTPAAGQFVVNAHVYYLDDANTNSLYVRDVIQSPSNDEQIDYLGCIGDVTFGYERGALLTASYDLKLGTFNGPASLGYAAPTFSADAQGAAFVLQGATTLLQPIATTTTTQYPFYKFGAKLVSGLMHRDEHGGVNGHTGVMRVGPKLAGTITLQTERDPQILSYWQNRTPLRLLHAVPQGTGTTMRMAGFHAPYAVITGVSKVSDQAGRRMYESTIRCLMNTSFGTKLGRAPWQYFLA